MLGQDTYREWTRAFSEGGHYEGSWEQGAKIVFLGPDPETGKEGGMVARVKESRPYEFVSVEHIGMIKDGIEDTTSEEVKKWTPAFENYTFTERDGGTEVTVDIDTAEEFEEMFKEMWPKALGMLKEICERA
jgi:hypothetical protein